MPRAALSQVLLVEPTYTSWSVTDTTEIVTRTAANGWSVFESSTGGTGKDNPTDPRTLTQVQEDRSVSVFYQNR